MGETQVVILSEELNMETLEGSMISSLTNKVYKTLIFDMARVDFIHAEVLVFFLSLVQTRRKQNKYTKFRFPLKVKPISFMKRWKFHNAIEELTGLNIEDFSIREADLDFLQNAKSEHIYSAASWEILGETHSMRSDSFIETIFYNFEKETLKTNYRNSSAIIRNQHERYNNPHIQIILNKKFHNSDRTPITNTLTELINNAFDHPNATSLAVMSYCPETNNFIGNSFVEITVLDNGTSIPFTLHEANSEGFDITKSVSEKNILVNIDVDGTQLPNLKNEISQELFNKDVNLSELSIEEFLVASIFPGVSSRRQEENYDVGKEFPEFTGRLSGDGNGLFIAAYVVCHSGRGSLVIRTAGFVMTISANLLKTNLTKSEFGFNINLRYLDLGDLHIIGNLITAKLYPERSSKAIR